MGSKHIQYSQSTESDCHLSDSVSTSVVLKGRGEDKKCFCVHYKNKTQAQMGHLARQLEEHVTLDLKSISLSLTLGIEIT